VLSTVLHWLVARRFEGLWILPDEAIYARRGLDLYRHGSLPVLNGQGAGYGVLYPVVAGLPLSVGSLERGYHALKLLQAIVMSLAAIPAYVWARRLMPTPHALVAALLTVASPIVLYSGFVMTEVLYYPLAALALFTIARAVEIATPRAQVFALAAIAAAVATRVQAVVLVGVFALAIVMDALLAREPRRLRRFPAVWATLALAALAALLAPGILGSYAGVIRGSYPLAAAGRLTLDHGAWLVVSTGVVPMAALGLLFVAAVRGGERDPAARAYLSVAVAASVLVVVQVGFFASRYAPHLLGRDLAALPPVVFIGFSLWLARGTPRPRVAAPAVVLATAALMVTAPWQDLVAAEALPDTFGLAILYRLRDHDPASIVALAGGLALILFALVPRAMSAVLPALVLALLLAGSIAAAGEIRSRVIYDQVHLVGQPRDWVDRAARGGVTYVYDDEPYWNGVWQTTFWNERIDDVVTIGNAGVPGPLTQRTFAIRVDGRLPTHNRFVVASDGHTFVGNPRSHIVHDGTPSGGLTLWRLDEPARISMIRTGFYANGDIREHANLDAYDCDGGRLALTLLPKLTQVVTVMLDGKVALRASLAGKPFYDATVNVPRSARPRLCHFTIEAQALLGTTRIAFTR